MKPREDPHFRPTHADEGVGSHFQATAQQAAERGWYWRPNWWEPLIPDTRRCFMCGEFVFEPLPLTDEEKAIRDPSSPNIMVGPSFRWP